MLSNREMALCGFVYEAARSGDSLTKVRHEIELADDAGLFSDEFLAAIKETIRSEMARERKKTQ